MTEIARGVQAAIRACRHLPAGLCYRCAKKMLADQTVTLRAEISRLRAAVGRRSGPAHIVECVLCGSVWNDTDSPKHSAACAYASPRPR